MDYREKLLAMIPAGANAKEIISLLFEYEKTKQKELDLELSNRRRTVSIPGIWIDHHHLYSSSFSPHLFLKHFSMRK